MFDTASHQPFVHAVDLAPAGAPPVGDHAHVNAALGSADQRCHHALAGVVGGENISFEIDFVTGVVDRCNERGKIIRAGMQELDFVIGEEVDRGAHGAILAK